MKQIAILPKRIILEKNIDNSKELFKKKSLQIGINIIDAVIFHEKSFIILDFGEEVKGSLRLLTFRNNNAKIRIRYGESVTESSSNIGEKNSTNDHSERDFYVNPPTYSDQTYINSGFRFVRIDVESGELIVQSLVVMSDIFDKKTIYEYEGNDLLIKDIFNTAKRTVSLCASGNYVWDGIKRDRLVWYGDLHPEMLALTTIYGRTKQVEKSIDLARREYKLPLWLNNFPSYSMWWIITVCDYYEMTKCEKFVLKQINYLVGLIDLMNEFVSDDGEMRYPFYFTDWQTFETDAGIEGVRAINIIAVNKAIMLFDKLNIDNLSAIKLLNKLKKKEIKTYGKKEVIALKCLADKKTDREDYNLLVSDGAKGLSTFMSFYILKAVSMFDKNKAIDIMKEYFGKMLSLGATTFWEDFDICWLENACRIDEFPNSGQKDIHGDFGAYCYKGFRHSLCHGWSSGIVAFIKEIDT